jgi:guanylate kinase
MATDLNTGKCILFSAPSGAGKTTIVRHLLDHNSMLAFSISACSRTPRGVEVDGKDYYFLGVEKFQQKIKEEAFLEWEEVYADNYYGTLKEEVERIWSLGKTVVFDVDVVGALNIKKQLGERALAIFVQAPSYEELERRLRSRSTESEEKIQMRMAKAKDELAKSVEFDVILENNELSVACQKAEELVAQFLKNQ